MYELIISPESILKKRWAYDDETEEGKWEYESVEVSDMIVHLGSTIEFKGKVTFERIFDIIIENKELYNLVFHSQMGGYGIEAFIEDYNGPQEFGPDEVEFLEIYAYGDKTTYYDGTTSIIYGVDFHGWGKYNEKETGQRQGPYSLGFSPLSDYRMLELKLCKNATFGISPKDITKREDFITYKGETTYTWYDIVSSILHEISWYGTPSNRDIYLDELKDRVDGVDKDLKSGNTSSLMDN